MKKFARSCKMFWIEACDFYEIICKSCMTKNEITFNELKDEYAKEYLRTNGKKVISLKYQNGFVYVNAANPVRISKFKEMLNVLKGRPTYKFQQDEKVKVMTDSGYRHGEFHRYGETRNGAIVFFDGKMSFVDEQTIEKA